VKVPADAPARLLTGGVLLALLFLVTACGSAPTAEVGPECGTGVAGPGFDVFACMSGGFLAGHPHPKELLVVRKDGSSASYPAYRVGRLAVGDGKVVAVYDDTLVGVTSRSLVPLVTQAGLAHALHRRALLVMGYDRLRVDARGDLYFFVSTLIRGRYGCQSRLFERLAGGRIRQLWTSSAPPNDICY
jgi:hypothetical protein